MIKWVGKRNGKDGPCANCMQLVPRDQGLLCIDESRGRWLVFHLTCAPAEIQAQVAARTTAAATPTALVLDVRDGRSGPEVVIRQTGGRMTNDMFGRYREAVRECCRNEKQADGSWVAVAPLEQGGEVQAQLEQAGFRVEPTPALVERLASKIAVIQTVTAMAAERAAQVDAILRARGLYLYPFQSAGVQWLAPRNKALLADAMGLGKGHPVDTKVLTPSGWRRVGDLVVGDEITGSDGRPTTVTATHQRGTLPVFRVRFNDRSSVLVDGDHLWAVQTPSDKHRGAGYRTMETRALAGDLAYANGNRKWSIPMLSGPAVFAPVELPVDPYLMGVWLGDGSAHPSTVKFTPGDELVPAQVALVIGDAFSLSRTTQEGRKDSWSVVKAGGPRSGRNDVVQAFRDLDLIERESHERFVPRRYLFASPDQRAALVQGLMDTDGEARPDGCVQFCTTSERLANDLRFLVESLGGTVRSSEKTPYYTYKGERREGRPAHVLTLAFPDWVSPFRAWAERYKPREKYKVTRYMDAIEPAGVAEVVCLSVAAEDKLYVTEHCLVTHNTVQACTAFPDNAPVVVVCPAVVKTNWQDELARWRPERAPAVILEGRGTFTRWPQAGETFILNFAILPEDLTRLGPPAPGTYLIADEAQNLKSLKLNMDGTVNEKKSSQQAGRFFNMRTAVFAAMGAVWLLTGTPIMNRAEELWAVLQQADLARDAFGSFKNYMAAWNATPGRYGGVEWGYPNEEVVGERLQRVMLRREKTEVLADLPPKSYQTIIVPIDAASRAELEQYSDEIMGALHAGDPTFDPAEDLERIHAQEREAELEQSEGASEKLTEREKLLLAGSESTSFEKLSKAREALARAKLPALIALVDQHEAAEPNEPLIVFSAHLEPLRALARRPGWAILDGSVSAKKRGQLVRAFQAGQLRGLAASIKASGVGITLTRANKAVFLDRDWTPSNNLQAEDRIYRIGQFRPTTIVTLIAEHPVDELITSNLTWKERIIRGSIMAGKRGPTEEVLEPVRMVHEAPALPAPAVFDPAAAGFALGPLDPVKAREEYLRRLRQEEIEEEIRVRQGRKQTREERARARLQPTPEQVARPGRRGAQTPLEEWAAYGIVTLTGLDADRAFEENYAGWSKSSTTQGHQFAALLLGHGGLTDDEWEQAVALVKPYQGQVGPPPGVDPASVRTRKRTVKKLTGDVFAAGDRVMTPDGPGAVVEKYARTYAVRLDDGRLWKGGAAKLLRDGPGMQAAAPAAPALTPADMAELSSAMGAPPPAPAPEYNPFSRGRGTSAPPPWYW